MFFINQYAHIICIQLALYGFGEESSPVIASITVLNKSWFYSGVNYDIIIVTCHCWSPFYTIVMLNYDKCVYDVFAKNILLLSVYHLYLLADIFTC